MIDQDSDSGSWQRELDAMPRTTGELRLELMDLRTQANRLARENEQLVSSSQKVFEASREAVAKYQTLRKALQSCGIDAESILRIATVIQGVKPEETR